MSKSIDTKQDEVSASEPLKTVFLHVLKIGAFTCAFFLIYYFIIITIRPGLNWNQEIPTTPNLLSETDTLNPIIQDYIRLYPTDGSFRPFDHKDDIKNMGVTQDLYYRDNLIAKGNPDNSSHCIGLNFEVYLKAWEKLRFPYMLNLKLGDGSVKRFFRFQQKFYGAGKDGTKKTFVDALVSEGLGVEVTSLSDAKPGDFVQLWRNNKTGHSGIFQNWITNDKNDIIGIRYFQVSKKTHGIGYCEDMFGSEPNQMILEETFIVRPIIRKSFWEI